jgi:uncharacterized tellurite resistance protein B-like protein
MKASRLTDDEKMFLAGCIRNLILADGNIQDEEVAELNKVIDRLHFNDFDEKLDRFENTITSTESFWEEAATITNPETQDLILDILNEIALQEGLIGRAEKKVITDLQTFWQQQS